MIKRACFALIIFVFAGTALAQPAGSSSRPPTPLAQTQIATPFELSEYGVSLKPDARLIITMAALDAAGFPLTPLRTKPSAFGMLVAGTEAKPLARFCEKVQAFFYHN